ncbi:MAG: thermonuclease family protein [Deltaproteobacteria bacterium]|nr:thermonuclease family protein [Deltaproteobacteria bacterium]
MSITEIRLKTYKSMPLVLAWVLAPLLLAGCSKYEDAEEKLRFAFPEYIKCDVIQVIDGDRFHCQLSNKEIEKVRLIGVEIPEKVSDDATYFTKSNLRRGTPVKLEFDEETRDSSGSILAYVYLPGGKMLIALLLEDGYARAVTNTPNVKFKDLFLKIEAEAREQGKGLWERD